MYLEPNFFLKFNLTTLNLIVFEKNNTIWTLLINATICLSFIKKSNAL